ncbi:hypothetical protein N2152v2_005968 [Parachlorella kessleri]
MAEAEPDLEELRLPLISEDTQQSQDSAAAGLGSSCKQTVFNTQVLDYKAPGCLDYAGAHAAGRAGHALVVAFALVELFGGTCIVLLVVWQQLALLLPSDGLWGQPPLQVAALVASLAMAPTLFLRNFKSLAGMSLLGFSSSVLLTLVVLSLLPLDPHRTGMPQQSVGIFAVSVSGHSTLPSLRAAMRKPALFPRVLTITFSVMMVFYMALAAAGYFYFGDASAPLVTANLAVESVFSGRALLGVITVDRLLAALILVSCIAKYPVLVMVIQDMLFNLCPPYPPGSPPGFRRMPRQVFVYAVRLTVFLLGVAISYSSQSFIGVVISLVGGLCSISCSLVLPTAFFCFLAWKDLNVKSKAGLSLLLLVGVGLVCSITAQNLCAIISHAHQQQGEEPAPSGLHSVVSYLLGGTSTVTPLPAAMYVPA